MSDEASRSGALERIHSYFDDGTFEEELARRVSLSAPKASGLKGCPNCTVMSMRK